jgi:hypothetical protein
MASTKETQDSVSAETRELEQRQFLQFQEKMLKKDAQMAELEKVMLEVKTSMKCIGYQNLDCYFVYSKSSKLKFFTEIFLDTEVDER